jgi:riboflavin kinase/FMN adenylyltransferase
MESNAPPEAGDRPTLVVMTGMVVPGDQRGRLLGFPTANLQIARGQSTPPEGVYAGVATIASGSRYPAALSLGRRPTFYPDGFELLEAHLLDFSDDLYGEPLIVHFHRRLRGQMRFNSIDELRRQLGDDVREVHAIASELLGAASVLD